MFLRLRRPYDRLNSRMPAANIMKIYQSEGFSHHAGDGKGFHSFRRTMGTRLIKADVPLTTVSQILGHTNFDSTKRYLFLQNFDRYCMEHFPEAEILTEEIALGWCAAGKEFKKSAYRANAIREFGRYLAAVGKNAYVLPREFFPSKRAELPHLFTDEELIRFFDAADHFPHYARSPLAEYIVPVVFRLQYACGLRPQEARLLCRADFDFRKNTVYISESKWCKDRCLPIEPKQILTFGFAPEVACHASLPVRHATGAAIRVPWPSGSRNDIDLRICRYRNETESHRKSDR